jgi:aminopeptidase N
MKIRFARIGFCFMLLTAVCYFVRADTRSDSIVILHYDIDLSIQQLSTKTIGGHTTVTCLPRVDSISYMTLDFLKLNITSVEMDGVAQSYSRNDSVLFITLSQVKNTTDTFHIKVNYNGQPGADPKWGGFIFSGNYAFNLGVGFAVDPHNFGRCWFPCFDNFTERSTADLHITTDSGYKAVCGGLLISAITHPDNSITWNWSMSTPAPTYLLSVSVSNYEFVHSTYAGHSKNIPVMLAAHAVDTTNLKNSFQHLPNALSIFEDRYGDYAFERVGYNLVPFNGGAMEHACNITYPLFAVDGTTTYETLFAHELSHHWWGNLVTCRTAGDMWLNEGWASYSEKLFLEKLYNKQAYATEVKRNHMDVLRYAHIKDGDFRAISGIPHQYTYGEHVYHKGSDVIHTLRGYVGDSAFFDASRSYLSRHAFKDVSSYELQKEFTDFTTADILSFFHDWVYNKGFCDFKIQSLFANGANAHVTIEQNTRAADDYYRNVPLTITFYDVNWTSNTRSFIMSGNSMAYSFSLPFTPVFAVIDKDEQISYARTKNTAVIKTTGSTTYPDALLSVNVTSITDSALLHLEHHWTAADQVRCNIPGLYLSNYRYWSVDGIWHADFKATAYFSYDGTTPAAMTSGYLDHTLLRATDADSTHLEDSLVLLWRQDANSYWQLLPDSIVAKQPGNLADKKGRFFVKELRQGEYALGMYDQTLAGITDPVLLDKHLLVYPNPAEELIHLQLDFTHQGASVVIIDMQGRSVLHTSCAAQLNKMDIDVSMIPHGNYILQWNDGRNKLTKKIVIN